MRFVDTLSAILAALALGPGGNAFYTPPSPLPAAEHGSVIWSRPLTGAAVLPDAVVNTLVLYHTTSVTGRDVAVSGAIAIPPGSPPPGGWPTISWAHGTTGNAPQCAPTRLGDRDEEQTYLDQWIAQGYAVVQTDYEGQGTPGLHPYFVGEAAARDVTDIVRAARELYPQIGTSWFAFGHSEGGSASLFTGQYGPTWAPELHLLGVVSFAPGSHLEAIFRALPKLTTPDRSSIFLLEMVEGIASVDPSVDLASLVTPQTAERLPQLQQECTDELFKDPAFASMAPSDILKTGVDRSRLLADFTANDVDRAAVAVPVLLLQGSDDHVVPPALSEGLDYQLCADHVRTTFDEIDGKNHGTIVTQTFPLVRDWVDAVASGNPPAANCT